MARKFLADQNRLVFQYESGTYGTASGTRQWIGLVQDHTPDEGAGIEPIRYQGTASRNVAGFVDGPLEYTGTFTYYPQDWKFLGFAIGSVSETAGAGSHVITEVDSNDVNYAVPTESLSPFTLEDSKDVGTAGSNFIRTFKGCMVDTYSINMSEGNILSCDVGYRAQSVDFSSGAVTAVTVNASNPFMWGDVAIHLPSGTALTNCTEFTFNVNNNLEARFPLNGSRTIEQAIPLNRDYEVSATFIMDAGNAKTLYDQYYIGGSEFNSMVKIQGSVGSAFIIMSGCQITDMEVPSPVEGLHDQTCTIVPETVSANIYDTLGSVYNAWK